VTTALLAARRSNRRPACQVRCVLNTYHFRPKPHQSKADIYPNDCHLRSLNVFYIQTSINIINTMGSVEETPSLISGLAHVNLTVPAGTLDLAQAFYGGTLGLKSRPVPSLQRDTLAWFDIANSGQQIHVAFGANENMKASRHPCFKIASPEALLELRQRIWDHHAKGDKAAPKEADKPGELDSGEQGVEYPQRFFARDYAGNRLEFSV